MSVRSIKEAPLITTGSTADVHAWGAGHVLKLFKEHVPWHANEVVATRAAHKAGLPVPAVIDGLIEVGQREGIVFEQVDGPIMTRNLRDRPDKVDACARLAAELHARVHSTENCDLPLLTEVLAWSIQQAEPLEERIRKAVLDVLIGLPPGGALCHNDFYPNNIIVRPRGLVVIDWAIGTRGSPLADHARTWLISKMWLGQLAELETVERLLMWQRFWAAYFRRYGELRPSGSEDLTHWQIVVATASLAWDKTVAATDQRLPFIKAALRGVEHPWLS